MLVMDETTKQRVCSSTIGAGGWDIAILADAGPVVPGCPSNRECDRTVTIDGKCYDSFAVNYYLFGLLNKLCGFRYVYGAVWVYTWNNYRHLHPPGAKSVWYCKGYYGRPAQICNGQSDYSRFDCGVCSQVFRGPFKGHFGTNPSVTFDVVLPQ